MTAPGTIASKIRYAEKNLRRQLDWVSRHDLRTSFTITISIGMLGAMFSLAPGFDEWSRELEIFLGCSTLLLLAALFFIYLGQYPLTKSPNRSLLFFATIADNTSDEFIERFRAFSDEDYLTDLLMQAHINAVILTKKFAHIKFGLIFLLLAVVPWSVTLYIEKSVVSFEAAPAKHEQVGVTAAPRLVSLR
jgi:hypothetical protein